MDITGKKVFTIAVKVDTPVVVGQDEICLLYTSSSLRMGAPCLFLSSRVLVHLRGESRILLILILPPPTWASPSFRRILAS